MMEIQSRDDPSRISSSSSSPPRWFETKFKKLRAQIVEFGHTTRNTAKDDPRRVIHSIKVGLAIALVSMFYYFDPLFEGFGVAAMWAVLTVVVVFEFSVGATLGKGANRVAATIFGGLLGVVAHRAAIFSGENLEEKLEPVILGSSVFLMASFVTFLRFFPKLKARYDYGLNITILTFSLVCVSAYREDEMLEMAYRRISTIIIGSAVALGICVCICPVWAGHDLHDLVASSVMKLGNFLQEFGIEYFKEPEQTRSEDKKTFMEGFKSVLNSKSGEDTLINFANWEPRHDRFKYRHPWHQYQKVGKLARECACTLDSLNRYLHAENQAPREVKAQIEQACTKMSWESGKALKELARAIKTMTRPKPVVWDHIESCQSVSKTAVSLIRTTSLLQVGRTEEQGEDDDLDLSAATISATAVVSLLLEAATSVQKIANAVDELASIARFKRPAAGDEPPATKRGGRPHVRNNGVMERVKTMGRVLSGQYTIDMVDYEECSSGNPNSPRRRNEERDPPSLAMAQHSGAE